MLESVEHVVLEQLLVGHTHLDWHTGWTMLSVPVIKSQSSKLPVPQTCTHNDISMNKTEPGIAKEKKKRKYLGGSGDMLPWKIRD